MGYRNLRQCLDDLEATGQLIRLEEPVDGHLEAAEIQRRVYQAGGPAILYTRVHNCGFPLVSNLFGSIDRLRYIFRDSLDRVRRLVELKVEPAMAGRRPWRYAAAARAALHTLPRRVRRGAVLQHQTQIERLPRVTCWPEDGGPFITLPQVYTEHPATPGWRHSNLGMYRVQLSGNQYGPDRIGLHYQIHRGIGVHHAAALACGEPLRVSIWIGGPPALAVAAVMPLPENLPEIAFAGALGGRRPPLVCRRGLPAIHAEADFCITGTIDGRLLPEGPFGDHLGYYSLVHDFPALEVEHVFHRAGAIWPFTVVGRPPQEDTTFGQFVHELTGPAVPSVVPGVHAVHAVDAAGVHPLLLAIGSERYVPYDPRSRPRELLTQANAILGQGQMSLAKYLLIVAREDCPQLDIHDVPAFFGHLLERVDWTRDLHFQTCTTLDTLDYSGTALNEGSKLVIAAVGAPRRQLPRELRCETGLPPGFGDPRVGLPGVLVIAGPPASQDAAAVDRLAKAVDPRDRWNDFPLWVVVDDADMAARSLRNLLWVAFTRSNPAADLHGVGASIDQKHWGCRGSAIIDARIKPHHAGPLVEDPQVTRRVDSLAAPGRPLHGII